MASGSGCCGNGNGAGGGGGNNGASKNNDGGFSGEDWTTIKRTSNILDAKFAPPTSCVPHHDPEKINSRSSCRDI